MKRITKSVRIEIKRENRNVTIRNNKGESWQFKNPIDEQTALSILVAKTIWSQYDKTSWYHGRFKISLEIEPLEEE